MQVLSHFFRLRNNLEYGRCSWYFLQVLLPQDVYFHQGIADDAVQETVQWIPEYFLLFDHPRLQFPALVLPHFVPDSSEDELALL